MNHMSTWTALQRATLNTARTTAGRVPGALRAWRWCRRQLAAVAAVREARRVLRAARPRIAAEVVAESVTGVVDGLDGTEVVLLPWTHETPRVRLRARHAAPVTRLQRLARWRRAPWALANSTVGVLVLAVAALVSIIATWPVLW